MIYMIVFARHDSPVITSKETKSAGQSCSWAETVSRQVAARQRLSRELLMVVVGRSDNERISGAAKKILALGSKQQKIT